MIAPLDFVEALDHIGVQFVSGVPDSLLKEVCACITRSLGNKNHVIAANEGAAIGLAIGHYLGTGSLPLVYMQNSGIGNAINPLVSLADNAIYSIPMVLMIGWRGEISATGEQVKDEPQHLKQGRITSSLLDVLEIPYFTIDPNTSNIFEMLLEVRNEALRLQRPVALLVRKGTFSVFDDPISIDQSYDLSREQAIHLLLSLLPARTPVVSTTGMISREVFEFRKLNHIDSSFDFLTVGGMGHAVSIAAGLSIGHEKSKIVCLDGDGALLMHGGAITNTSECSNLVHILLNNEVHDSVGGQPTQGGRVDFIAMARACGYKYTKLIETENSLRENISLFFKSTESVFIEIKCRKGHRDNLIRPDISPSDSKQKFMSAMESL